MAGTSQSTMNKVIQIQKHAPEPIKDAVESNVISINKGYELTKRVKDVPEKQKLSKAEELVEEQFKQECKELDKAHKIYCKFVDAVYKPISIEVTEENVNYWLQDKTQEEINFEEKNINDGIENLVKLREMLKKYKVIRVVK